MQANTVVIEIYFIVLKIYVFWKLFQTSFQAFFVLHIQNLHCVCVVGELFVNELI